jgi:hypothetical protein
MPEPGTLAEWQDEFRGILWSPDSKAQAWFKEQFGDELDIAAQALGEAYFTFKQLQEHSVPGDERSATVQMFLHVAIASVAASLHHLVSGYPIAAGHTMRHFTEAIAMALMCSNEKTGVYQRYAADRKSFAVQKAPELLLRTKIKRELVRSISFDAKAWETILQIAQLYDSFSHASFVSLGFHILFTGEGGLILGSEFDPAKVNEYRSDVTRRRSAAQSVAHIVPIIMNSLPKKDQQHGAA